MPRSGAAALRAPLTAALTGRFWVDQASPAFVRRELPLRGSRSVQKGKDAKRPEGTVVSCIRSFR